MLKISSNLKQFCKIYCWSWHMGSRIWNIFFSNQILNKHTTLSLLFYFLSFYFLLCLNNFQSIQELDWKGCVGGGGGGYEHPPPPHSLCIWQWRVSLQLIWLYQLTFYLCVAVQVHVHHYLGLDGADPERSASFLVWTNSDSLTHVLYISALGPVICERSMGCLMMHVNIIMRKIEETGCNELMSALCLDKSNLMLWCKHKLHHFSTLLYIKFCKNEIKNVCQTTFFILYLYKFYFVPVLIQKEYFLRIQCIDHSMCFPPRFYVNVIYC